MFFEEFNKRVCLHQDRSEALGKVRIQAGKFQTRTGIFHYNVQPWNRPIESRAHFKRADQCKWSSLLGYYVLKMVSMCLIVCIPSPAATPDPGTPIRAQTNEKPTARLPLPSHPTSSCSAVFSHRPRSSEWGIGNDFEITPASQMDRSASHFPVQCVTWYLFRRYSSKGIFLPLILHPWNSSSVTEVWLISTHPHYHTNYSVGRSAELYFMKS